MTNENSPVATLRDRIHDLTAENGATFTASQFDGGTQYKVTQPGRGSVLVSYEYGDSEDQVFDLLRQKMTAAGMIGGEKHEYLLSYSQGEARIWATSPEQAQRLAMRGTPESITDLTTGEVLDA